MIRPDLCISCDSHVVETPEIFNGLEKTFGDRAPRIVYDPNRGDVLHIGIEGRSGLPVGALRLTGLATTVACLFCIAQFFVLRPVSAMAVAPQVIGLSVLNATLCTFAPVLMVMMAIERIGATMAAQTGMGKVIRSLPTIALEAI